MNLQRWITSGMYKQYQMFYSNPRTFWLMLKKVIILTNDLFLNYFKFSSTLLKLILTLIKKNIKYFIVILNIKYI